MFKWDGTDISDIINKSNIYDTKYNNLVYWIIQYEDSGINYEEICIVKNIKTTLPCVIDELKPIFGLQKLGTHWCIQGKKTKLLIKKIKKPGGHINEELSLKGINNIPHLLSLQIQEIFAFRELLGITCSYESSIILREGKYGLYPISFNDPNMMIEDTKVIPVTILDKYFKDTSIDKVVQKILKINSIDKLSMVLHNIRTKIDEVIERVDRRNISYKNSILNRITQRLQTTL